MRENRTYGLKGGWGNGPHSGTAPLTTNARAANGAISMTAREPVPGWTDPQRRAFRARNGDTEPDLIIPGLPSPGQVPSGHIPSGQVRPGQRPRGYAPPGRPRRRRLRRLVRRTLAVLGVLVFLAIAGFGISLLVTPSARPG